MKNKYLCKPGRKVYFWGIGNNCTLNMEWHPEFIPDGYIDSFKAGTIFNGKTVKSPSEINYSSGLFIVITTAYVDIKKILIEKGLKELEDFSDVRHFFLWDMRLPDQCVSDVKKYIDENVQKVGCKLVLGELVGKRQKQTLDFYQKFLEGENAMYLTRLYGRQDLEDMLHAPVFEFCGGWSWNNTRIYDDMLRRGCDFKQYYDRLDDETRNMIDGYEKRHCDALKIRYMAATLYWGYKEIVSYIKPSTVYIWGGWEFDRSVMERICIELGIEFKYHEFGVIPGTVSEDRKGLIGKSEIYGEKLKKNNLTLVEEGEVQDIKRLIINNGMDSYQFKKTSSEYEKLFGLDKKRKTILFAGMADHVVDMRCEPEFWDEHVSNVVTSSYDAISYIRDICNRRDWNFIVKPHPYTFSQIKDIDSLVGQNGLVIREMSIDDLCEYCDVVISISSKIDYKVLIKEKALVLLGKSLLSSKEIAYEVKSRTEMEETISLAVEKGFTEKQRSNLNIHIYELLHSYLLDDMSDREIRYGRSKA